MESLSENCTFRIKVDYTDLSPNIRKIWWFLIIPREYNCVNQLKKKLLEWFDVGVKPSQVELWLDGGVIPDKESVLLLKSNDVVVLRYVRPCDKVDETDQRRSKLSKQSKRRYSSEEDNSDIQENDVVQKKTKKDKQISRNNEDILPNQQLVCTAISHPNKKQLNVDKSTVDTEWQTALEEQRDKLDVCVNGNSKPITCINHASIVHEEVNKCVDIGQETGCHEKRRFKKTYTACRKGNNKTDVTLGADANHGIISPTQINADPISSKSIQTSRSELTNHTNSEDNRLNSQDKVATKESFGNETYIHHEEGDAENENGQADLDSSCSVASSLIKPTRSAQRRERRKRLKTLQSGSPSKERPEALTECSLSDTSFTPCQSSTPKPFLTVQPCTSGRRASAKERQCTTNFHFSGKHTRFDDKKETQNPDCVKDFVDDIQKKMSMPNGVNSPHYTSPTQSSDKTIVDKMQSSDLKRTNTPNILKLPLKKWKREKLAAQNDVLTNKSIIIHNPIRLDNSLQHEVEQQQNYDRHPVLEGPPRVNDIIVYKVLELSVDYTPEVSQYKIGKVLKYDALQQEVLIQYPEPVVLMNRSGKFELASEDELPESELIQEEAVNLSTMVEIRLMNDYKWPARK